MKLLAIVLDKESEGLGHLDEEGQNHRAASTLRDLARAIEECGMDGWDEYEATGFFVEHETDEGRFFTVGQLLVAGDRKTLSQKVRELL